MPSFRLPAPVWRYPYSGSHKISRCASKEGRRESSQDRVLAARKKSREHIAFHFISAKQMGLPERSDGPERMCFEAAGAGQSSALRK